MQQDQQEAGYTFRSAHGSVFFYGTLQNAINAARNLKRRLKTRYVEVDLPDGKTMRIPRKPST